MGSYFEQVLYYANLRFSKMTGGRYEIVRGESRDKRISAGLEISVRDNFNNKERDISSLSGGESFRRHLHSHSDFPTLFSRETAESDLIQSLLTRDSVHLTTTALHLQLKR